jgi:hypothetical protein
MNVYEKEKQLTAPERSGPHGWIQWKGTDVCMDVYCSCGKHTHVDADFCYHVKCGACGALFAVCATVRLMPVTEQEIKGRCEPVVTVCDDVY